MTPPQRRDSLGHLVKLLCLLWLLGIAMRIPILAVPPVVPLIHDELHLSETQVGLLIGLPVALFALAAVPGSLLIARLGVAQTILIGLVLTALASAARGGADNVVMLYAMTALTGAGISIMQPALPQLVREWVPQRIALGTAVYTNGLLLGTTITASLTIPVVLPLAGSWQAAFAAWAVPVAAMALIFVLLRPRVDAAEEAAVTAVPARWWPDWRSPITWLLGLAFGSNNAIYFGCNAFLPDYLATQGRPDLIGPALGWLNGAQLFASFLLLVAGERMHRRAWPVLAVGTITFTSLVGVIIGTGPVVVVCAALIGFATAITFVVILALPPVLSAPEDVHRTAAGMFTISFSCAVIVPIISGALWDVTGRPAMAFAPFVVAAVTLAALGTLLVRRPPYVG